MCEGQAPLQSGRDWELTPADKMCNMIKIIESWAPHFAAYAPSTLLLTLVCLAGGGGHAGILRSGAVPEGCRAADTP